MARTILLLSTLLASVQWRGVTRCDKYAYGSHYPGLRDDSILSLLKKQASCLGLLYDAAEVSSSPRPMILWQARLEGIARLANLHCTVMNDSMVYVEYTTISLTSSNNTLAKLEDNIAGRADA